MKVMKASSVGEIYFGRQESESLCCLMKNYALLVESVIRRWLGQLLLNFRDNENKFEGLAGGNHGGWVGC